MTDYMDVVVPIELENGKTIWHKVGTAFPNNNPNKKHKMVISMISIPLGIFMRGEVKMFIFPQKDRRSTPPAQPDPGPPPGPPVRVVKEGDVKPNKHLPPPPPPIDEDVPY